MNRRQLLRLGAMAAVAPKVLVTPVTPVTPVTWVAPAFGNGLIAHIQALHARAIEEAGINWDVYQAAVARKLMLVATKMGSEGQLFRSAPVSVLP